ncbi:transporter, partial [Bifidobacterium animalis subsp. lactis]
DLYNYFIVFYPHVNSPFSLLLELLSFLSTLAIALAGVVEGEGKMLILSKFSSWLCVGSCSVLEVMSRALFSGLGVIKANAVIVSSIIIIYYLARFSIVFG